MFTELPWNERFMAAKEAGFDYVEFWSWTDKDLDEIRRLANEANIKISGFNGDADYSLIDPTHKDRYLSFLKKSIDVAKKIGAEGLLVHSNALDKDGQVINDYNELSDTIKICSMFDMLKEAASMAEKNDISLYLEPLNVTTDHVGNYLKNTAMAADIVRLIDSPNLKILYDIYHMQLNEGSICDNLSKHIDIIGHIHIADAPGRHEPGTGEINYTNIIKKLRELDFNGKIGCELFPSASTEKAVEAIMKIFQ